MPSAASHRHKRPFQPEITSYFTRADRDTSGSSPSQPASSRGAPELPHSVQVSLLNVGMRIRKAVPEGYKTHKTSLFSDPTPARAAFSSPASLSGHLRPRGELLPFCGLHKIGGLSIQPISAQSEIDIFADEMPFNLSQESTTSTLSTDSMPAALPYRFNMSKRRFEDEENEGQENDELPDVRFSGDFCSSLPIDLSISPTHAGYPISHTAMPDLVTMSGTRTIAKPKSRRKGVSTLAEPAAPDFDFEDAEFLVWDEEMVGM
jgi:hypothetical protein